MQQGNNNLAVTGEYHPAAPEQTYTVILSNGDEMFIVPGVNAEDAATRAVASWANRYGEVVEAVRVCPTGVNGDPA
ncbi:MAG: hypothetical protein ACREPD_04865 [Stenotrophomonas sp.]|uniref:hypothetical protein n=1 Tax=Stenotrophomonas sp. TaxID=69392 RepID=UPI003D6D78E4